MNRPSASPTTLRGRCPRNKLNCVRGVFWRVLGGLGEFGGVLGGFGGFGGGVGGFLRV